MTMVWRADPLADKQLKTEVSIRLHREAGKRGFSCTPKKSAINGRYFAEINQSLPTGKTVEGIPTFTSRLNVKMGTGETPLQAAVDGYRLAVPIDDMMAVLYLEVEAYLLCETARVIRRLEIALEDLEALIPHV